VPRNTQIDARGLSCPQPVMLAQKAILAASAGDVIEVLVDNVVARENVTRFAASRGCQVKTAVPDARTRQSDYEDDLDEECFIVRITVGGAR
jgi:tRNA 2-thiouridine synthesizing protein A